MILYDMIYLLTAIVLPPGGSSKVYIYKQKIHRTTQNKQYIEQHKSLEECGPCPFFASYTLAFALQLKKKQMQSLQNIGYQLSEFVVVLRLARVHYRKKTFTVSLAFTFIFPFYSTLQNQFTLDFFGSLKIHSVDSTLFKLIQICSNILK